MDVVAVQELFDRTLRAARPPTVGVDRTWCDGVLRTTQGDHHFIGWWDFAPDRTAAIVAREAAHLRSVGGDLLWTVYGHDRPKGLERALADAGFEDQGLDRLLALEASAAANLERPPGVDVRQVRTEEELAGYAGVLRKAFGEEDWTTDDFYLPRLNDPNLVLLVAYVDGEPAATGRLETLKETPFAGLGDGGVVPQHRGAGLYRAIVADRAVEAARRGARYLHVTAWETSRPTLERLGFEPLATRHRWLLKAPSPS
jgi:GNAT superfamily N-acetyltransferase